MYPNPLPNYQEFVMLSFSKIVGFAWNHFEFMDYKGHFIYFGENSFQICISSQYFEKWSQRRKAADSAPHWTVHVFALSYNKYDSCFK